MILKNGKVTPELKTAMKELVDWCEKYKARISVDPTNPLWFVISLHLGSAPIPYEIEARLICPLSSCIGETHYLHLAKEGEWDE